MLLVTIGPPQHSIEDICVHYLLQRYSPGTLHYSVRSNPKKKMIIRVLVSLTLISSVYAQVRFNGSGQAQCKSEIQNQKYNFVKMFVKLKWDHLNKLWRTFCLCEILIFFAEFLSKTCCHFLFFSLQYRYGTKSQSKMCFTVQAWWSDVYSLSCGSSGWF